MDFKFPGRAGSTPKSQYALTGVLGSGNLEVMIESRPLGGKCHVEVVTSIPGFQETWEMVLEAFFTRHSLTDVLVSINDAGATPAVVSLRLDQAALKLIDGEGE